MAAHATQKFLRSVEGKILSGGKWLQPAATRFTPIYNPKDDSLITDKHAVCGEEDVNKTVATARAAFRGDWSLMSGAERGKSLYRLADLLEQNHEEAAYAESLCSGRVMSQLLYEVPWIASVIRYYAGWADKLEGDTLPADDGFYKLVQHEPLGVCAGITPWNGPLMVLALKAAPALAAGNTFILKPPEKSPLSSLYAGSLFAKAGIPDGVFNILTGDGLTGNLLAKHPDIDKVSFTGSVPTGRKIQEAANASNMKRVTLELGGKSPAIVFEDADIPAAVAALAQGITMNAGQVCVASSRVYVHRSILDQVVSGIKTEFDRIASTIGADPQDAATTFGPVVDKQQHDRVHDFIEQGKKDARLVTGGYKHLGQGNYVPPTLFVEPGPEASIYKQEIFGPVLCIRPFDTEEEAVGYANDTDFGLAAYVWTENIKRVLRVTRQIQAGHIGVNAGVALFPNAPFGGYKTSGAGKELGRYALDSYTNVKHVYIRAH